MKQVLRTISFLSIFLFIEGFLLSVSARTEITNKEVLVLNSINFNLPWAKNFYWCIHDALQKQGISVKAESLSVPALVNKMEADAVVTHLREKYPVAPAAIVLIGDPGWIVCRELFDDVWKDVPVIVTNARDRLPASLDVLLSHAPLTETNSVPGEEWRRGYNLTLLKQHYYVKETVELIYKLIPDMQRLAFISDDRYISEETRRDVKEAVEENFPDLRLDLLSTTQLSTEMLLDTLHSYKPNTGIIYYSWFESHNENDNNYLFDHIQEIITNFTPSPLFLLSPENLSNNTFAGGYYVSTESFCDSLLEILNRILNGEQARNIPGGVGGEGNSYLCYPVLKSYNIPSSRYPDDAVYIDKPQTFFQQHYVKIIASSVFLLLLIAAIVYYIRILRKAYSRLSEAVEKAEQANQLKSAFLANMSHEIRTPLNAIVGFSNMLPHTEDPVEMREYADIIETNTDLLLQLINDILDLSKIEAGTFDFYPSSIDVNQTLEEIEQSMRLRLKNSDVTLAFTERLPGCLFYIDKNRLIQLLANFVNNAIKFTQTGTICMGYRMTDTDTIYFYVSDTGCGMSNEQCEHVFERFVKYNPFIQGTGLGLSICRTIVERLGGKIGVDSEEGKGSTFWFTLPYRKR
ncbi:MULTISPECIES: ATP-binding protein [Bacteroides]|uniref:sensor histidine kinase n=1 Tax=Bacteroides TaxID=816 RepID=UPI0018A10443|nr:MULTISPECIES: ATP-binding protein [Bacteroides]MBS5757888.1 sensor histidine kinase [Bacteroides sp.]MBS5767506.1 sensor histidine kinase [Bacteroides sp.]